MKDMSNTRILPDYREPKIQKYIFDNYKIKHIFFISAPRVRIPGPTAVTRSDTTAGATMRNGGSGSGVGSRTASEIMKPVGRLKSPARVTSLSPPRNSSSNSMTSQTRTNGVQKSGKFKTDDSDGRTKGGGVTRTSTLPLRGNDATSRIRSAANSQSPIRGQQRITQSATFSAKSGRSIERVSSQISREKRPTAKSPEHTNSLRLVRNNDKTTTAKTATSDRLSSQRYRIADMKVGSSATIERTGIPVKNSENSRVSSTNKHNSDNRSELVKTRLYSNNSQLSNREIYSSHSFNSLQRPRVDRSSSRASTMSQQSCASSVASSKPWRNGSLKQRAGITPASPMVRTKHQTER